MENDNSDWVYSEQDIYKAFDMGFEWAIYVLEKTVGFTLKGRIQLIKELKKELSEDKEYESLVKDSRSKRTLKLVKS